MQSKKQIPEKRKKVGLRLPDLREENREIQASGAVPGKAGKAVALPRF
jgi:hypothetical protein